MSDNSSFIWVAAILAAGAVAWYFLRAKRRRAISVNEEKPEVTFAEVVAYFKAPKILETLKSRPGTVGVVVRRAAGEDLYVTLGLFNKTNSSVDPLYTIKTKALDDALRQQFGDKEMIILQ